MKKEIKEIKGIKDKKSKIKLFLGVVVARFLQLFKPKCPECGSRDNKIECYSGNPYAPSGHYETGRQCNNCTNFWFS